MAHRTYDVFKGEVKVTPQLSGLGSGKTEVTLGRRIRFRGKW